MIITVIKIHKSFKHPQARACTCASHTYTLYNI